MLICRHCNEPVRVNKDQYIVFEQMHWLCFHLVFEHKGDADEPCGDVACPWYHIAVFRQKLEELGHDLQEVLGDAILRRWNL